MVTRLRRGTINRSLRDNEDCSDDSSAEDVHKDLVAKDHVSSFDSIVRPQLRRAGSSMDSVSSLNDANDVDESIFVAKKEPIFLQHLSNTIYLQFKGVTQDFQRSGMPWKGLECCSLMAGCSGILYALPALVCPNQVERAAWILQACLSVLADYFHIHHDSSWHGIDRFFAIFNSIFIFYRACDRLHWSVSLLAIPPYGCYVAANRAKNQLDLSAWHWCHFGWHITGGVLATLVIHLLYSCPDTDPLLTALCQV